MRNPKHYIVVEDMISNMQKDAEKLPDRIPADEYFTIMTALNFLKGYLMKTPQADVEPVIHAKWIQVDENKCKCTNCDTTCSIVVYPHGNKNYCPCCGAEMRWSEVAKSVCQKIKIH